MRNPGPRQLNLISDTMQACEQMLLRGRRGVPALSRPRGRRPAWSTRASSKASVVGSRHARAVLGARRQRQPRWRAGADAPVNYLAYSAPSGLGRIVAARRGARPAALALETVFTSPLAATLLSIARAGDGVAWLPRTLAEEDIAGGRLVEAGGSVDPEIPIEIRLFRPIARQSQAAEWVWTAFEKS